MHRDHGVAGAAGALAALERSLDAGPSYRAELRVSQMWLREQRAPESAGAARQALAIEPSAPNAWAALAAADLAAGETAAARRDASESLRLLDDAPFALHLRAQAAARDGDPGAASADRAHLRALADHSDDPDTARSARTLLEGGD